MKRIISILLILVTAFYVLPVTDGPVTDTETSGKYAGKNTDDTQEAKKDSGKEFMPGLYCMEVSENFISEKQASLFFTVLPVHSTVETPPPDGV